MKALREKAEVVVLLTAPRINVGIDPTRLRGSMGAPVKIVEFSDFQCPFCRQAEATLKQVLTKYGEKVALAYRDFPLRQIHPHAQGAAEASCCAAEQNRFWEYHDALYDPAARLDPASLTDTAKKIGLDNDRFAACFAGGASKNKVDADIAEGTKAGVGGTPAFFVNGVFLSGAQPASEFEKIIDAELAAAGKNAGAGLPAKRADLQSDHR